MQGDILKVSFAGDSEPWDGWEKIGRSPPASSCGSFHVTNDIRYG